MTNSDLMWILGENAEQTILDRRGEIIEELHNARGLALAEFEKDDALLELLSSALRSLGQSLYLGTFAQRGQVPREYVLRICQTALRRYFALLAVVDVSKRAEVGELAAKPAHDPDVFPGYFTLDIVKARSLDAALAVLRKYETEFVKCTETVRQNAIVGVVLQLESRGLATNVRSAIEARLPGWPRVRRSCNLHGDCDAADAEWGAKLGGRAPHCSVEDCEDCFGK